MGSDKPRTQTKQSFVVLFQEKEIHHTEGNTPYNLHTIKLFYKLKWTVEMIPKSTVFLKKIINNKIKISNK